jgi:hypothetical protein
MENVELRGPTHRERVLMYSNNEESVHHLRGSTSRQIEALYVDAVNK